MPVRAPIESLPAAVDDSLPGSPESSSQVVDLAQLLERANLTAEEDWRDFDPDASPDGARFVFASTRDGPHPHIFMQRFDAAEPVRLTNSDGDHIQPRFSSDGQHIAFASNSAGDWDLWMMRADGSEPTRLTSDRGAELCPTWSPDGKQLAFSLWSERAHRWEIWILETDAPAVRSFLTDGMFPSWSPCGSRIAFQRSRTPGEPAIGIWVVDAAQPDATAVEVAASESTNLVGPRWSQDGTWIIASAVPLRERVAAPGVSRLRTARLTLIAPDARRRLTVESGGDALFDAVWKRDGRLLFVRESAAGEHLCSARLGPESVIVQPAERAGPALAGVVPPGGR